MYRIICIFVTTIITITAVTAVTAVTTLLPINVLAEQIPSFIPSFEEVKSSFHSSEISIVDKNDILLKRVRTDFNVYRMEWITLSEVSADFLSILLYSEDRDFYSHSGVAWWSLLSATWSQIKGSSNKDSKKRGGASTISMQLVKLLYKKFEKSEKSERSGLEKRVPILKNINDKIKQIQYARQLEKMWSKTQILEAYLNLIFFRGELQGIAAASSKLFKKSSKNLTIDEGVLLTVLVRSPNATVEKVIRRECLLREELKNIDPQFFDRSSDCSKLDDWTKSILHTSLHANTLQFNKGKDGDYIPSLGERGNLLLDVTSVGVGNGINQNVVKTSIDFNIQKLVFDLAKEQVNHLKDRNVNDAAVVVIHNPTDKIVAYLANIGEDSSATYVDGANARRQAGSILKPFLYAYALEKKYLQVDSILDDSPISIAVAGGEYNPQNYDKVFVGEVSLAQALASSLNVPAVRTLQLIGTDNFLSLLKDLGLTNLQRDDYYGPSLALGAVDVSLLEVANAMRVFANDGVWRPSSISNSSSISTFKAKRIFSSNTAKSISEILSNKDNRIITFGANSVLNTRGQFPVKTGTSKDMRDNWCVGFSKDYTVAVWVGNMHGLPMWNVSGVMGAAPIWAQIMDSLNHPLSHSDKLIAKIKTKATNFTNVSFPKITYPTDQTIIALDPDIPQKWQYIFFEAKDVSVDKNLWILNGEVVSRGEKSVKWKIRPGKYNLSLALVSASVSASDQKQGQNKILDQISFVVK
ncbi:MAG: transglycosylase domain-containing protein [Oligoflexia bacterium]|nr:transglycosylase domain-containing protein [Oligoflexia bacterium]